MPRPSSSDMLAAQLESAAMARSGPSSPSSNGQRSPGTPWLSDSFSFNSISSSPVSSPELPRRKFVSRGPTARRDEEDSGDEALEEELADFGYGSHRKSKPTESLQDLLNSEPPTGWSEEPSATPTTPRKMNVLQKKLRLGSRQSSTEESSNRGFSTLRSFRSSSSLLGLSKSRPIISDPIYDRIATPTTTPRKLAAKEAAPKVDSTADLADFLRAGPPRPSHSRSHRSQSSIATSAEAAATSNARILQAVVAKVGGGGSRASLVRSDSGSSHQNPSLKSPGSDSMFDASWRSHVLPSAEHEESLHESVSLFAAESRLSRSLGSTRAPSPSPQALTSPVKTSSAQLQRNGSLLASPTSSPTSPVAKRRLSRKPAPSVTDLDLHLPRSPPRSSKQLISEETLKLLGQAEGDSSTRYSGVESPVKGRTPLPSTSIDEHYRTSTMTFGGPQQSSGSNGTNSSSSDGATSSSGSSVVSLPNAKLPQPPPPIAPLPQVPARSSSRPTSLQISNINPFADRSTARFSTISHADTIRRAPSPSITSEEAPSSPVERPFDTEGPIVMAMRLLRRSMREAADLPWDEQALTVAGGDGTGVSRRRVQALLPTLKALQSQMREAANLVDLVVRLVEAERGDEEEQLREKELQDAERGIVDQLLG